MAIKVEISFVGQLYRKLCAKNFFFVTVHGIRRKKKRDKIRNALFSPRKKKNAQVLRKEKKRRIWRRRKEQNSKTELSRSHVHVLLLLLLLLSSSSSSDRLCHPLSILDFSSFSFLVDVFLSSFSTMRFLFRSLISVSPSSLSSPLFADWRHESRVGVTGGGDPD